MDEFKDDNYANDCIVWLNSFSHYQIFETFRSAFTNYPIQFNLSEYDFEEKFFNRMQVDKRLSPGYSTDGKLVAFILTSLGLYQEKLTAYNAGTGVLEEFRSKGLVYQIYECLVQKLKSQNCRYSVLEVLKKNERAIHVYRKVGFEIIKEYFCFELNPLKFEPKESPIHITEKVDFHAELHPTFKSWWEYDPSFADQILNKRDLIITLSLENSVAGYIIINPRTGRIPQIAVNPEFRNLGIGNILVRKAYFHSSIKELTVINVDSRNACLIEFLKGIGFKNHINQYEMELSF